MINQIAVTPIFDVLGEEFITESDKRELDQINYELMNSCKDLNLKGSPKDCLDYVLQNVIDYVDFLNDKTRDDPECNFYVWVDSSYNIDIEEYVDHCIDFCYVLHNHDEDSLSKEDMIKIKDETDKQREIFRVLEVFKKQNRLEKIKRVLIINFFIFRKNEPFGFMLPDGTSDSYSYLDEFPGSFWHDEEDDDDEDDDEYYD